jgi:hypothetical protein
MKNRQMKKGPDLILPMVWNDHMDKGMGDGMSDRMAGKVQTVARHILRLFWEARGCPVQLDSGPLVARGVSHSAQLRAVKDLERLGLIDVERHPNQVPVVRIPSRWTTAKTVYHVPWKVIDEEYDPWRREE